jgi:hypothetical protein
MDLCSPGHLWNWLVVPDLFSPELDTLLILHPFPVGRSNCTYTDHGTHYLDGGSTGGLDIYRVTYALFAVYFNPASVSYLLREATALQVT